MIRIFKLVLLLVVNQVAFGQAPSNYTNINGRYRWIAGMFDSTFHIPKGTSPSLRTGGSTNAGGLFYNTSDSSVYTYTGTQWIKARGSINPSDTTNKYVTQVYKKNGSDSVFYVKGGNHLFAFVDSVGSPGGGGGGKIYYFNGGVNMGTIGGFQMYELGDTANTGAAANFTRATTGNIANFITDTNKPGLVQIPAGVWSVDAWLSETGGGSNHAEIYVKVEKWNGSIITTIATSPIEQITEGSTPNLYTWSVTIPTTTLTVTDRIIIQFYIQNTNGKTVTLYTQNGYVGEVHTTFTTGIGAINGLTAPAQYLVTGTSGTDFNINSVTATHTFNLPTASATNRGALSSTDWTTFNSKIGGSGTTNYVSKFTGSGTIGNSQIFDNATSVGIGTAFPSASYKLDVNGNINVSNAVNYSQGGTKYGWTYATVGAMAMEGLQGADISLGTGSGAVATERMVIKNSGNVGIGITPDSMFTVAQGTHLQRGVRMSGLPSAVGTRALRIDANGTLSVADTLANGISGSGTNNYITKFTGSRSIGNSSAQDDGTTFDVAIKGKFTGTSGSDILTLSAPTNGGKLTFAVGSSTTGSLGSALALFGSGVATDLGITAESSSKLIFGSNNQIRMTLDASGNLGLGVSPSNWASGEAAMQTTYGTFIGNSGLNVGRNIYYNAGWKYIGTGHASLYNQSSGIHTWSTAVSGTAGNAVAFSDNMTLDASGRLGIGTTSPAALFDVTVNNAKTVTAGVYAYLGKTNEVSNYAALQLLQTGAAVAANRTWSFQTIEQGIANAGNISFQPNGGNVGIGTTSPDTKLQVQDGYISTYHNANVNDAGYGVEFYTNGGGSRNTIAAIYPSQVGTSRSGNLYFLTSNSGAPTEKMRITSGGNVGIGTQTPSASDWNANSRLLHIYQNTTDGSILKLESSNTSGVLAVGNDQFQIGAVTNDPLLFYTNSLPRMTILSGGNVGIGTNSPTGTGTPVLHINGTSNSELHLTNSTTGTVAGDGFTIQQNGNDTYIWNYENSFMSLGTNNTERMRITAGGEVYIGNNPADQGAYNLQVNGTGVWGAGAYVNGSDSALKYNIQPLEPSLDIVKQMKPVTFEYQPFYSKDTATQTGFIAQDLQRLLADKVYKNGIVKEGGAYLGVAYENIIPLLVKAIQEQQTQIDQLKAQLNNR